MTLNINSLTLGEVATVERLSDMPFSAIADEEKPKGLALAALAFVAKRRTDPAFSWNDAQALTFAELDGLIDLGGDDEPDDALAEFKGEAAPKALNDSAPKTSRRSSSTSA